MHHFDGTLHIFVSLSYRFLFIRKIMYLFFLLRFFFSQWTQTILTTNPASTATSATLSGKAPSNGDRSPSSNSNTARRNRPPGNSSANTAWNITGLCRIVRAYWRVLMTLDSDVTKWMVIVQIRLYTDIYNMDGIVQITADGFWSLKMS